MTIHKLKMGTLYLMSGPPASGKSTILKDLNLPEGFVLSSDKIREQLYGVKRYFENGKEYGYIHGWDKSGQVVFHIMAEMIRARAKEGLTTFVDAMSLSDRDRKFFIDIAQQEYMPVHVLIFNIPLEELHYRNNNRYFRVDTKVIDNGFKNLQRESKYPYTILDANSELLLEPPSLKGEKFDVVGDCHGLFDDFLKLIKSMGYEHDHNGVPYHKDCYKLVFLGDVIDRGQQSVLMLHYVEQAVRLGGHTFVPGNHEEKLVRTWENWKKTDELIGRSRSNVETMLELIKQPDEVQSRLIKFIKSCPAYKIIDAGVEKFACVHSDIEYFDPLLCPRMSLQYGTSSYGDTDTDLKYQENYDRGINKYTLLRGHILSTSKQKNVHSIEFDQAFDGHLAILRIKDYLENKLKPNAFDLSCFKQKVNFNYDVYVKNKFKVSDVMVKYEKQGLVQSIKQKETGLRMFNFADIQELINKKHVKISQDDTKELTLYKYGKSVFFDNLWSTHPFLEKARGLVLDAVGTIIQHPFDKIFNYGENGTAVSTKDTEMVQAIEKLNGFLGCITKHPYKEGELLVTTTGSFDSDFVGYINDFITPELKQNFLNHFKNCDETLMFEVIHPKDNEHPVEYKVEEQGLWLIGAREKTFNSKLKDEAYLDWLGTDIGLKRPKHFLVPFKQVREWANSQEGEGYIVRNLETGDPFVKFKTTNYLSVKFIGRLSENNIKFMYNQPDKFKLKLDEEYVPMVDALIARYSTAEAFKELSKSDRMSLIRDIVKTMRTAQEQEATLKIES